MKLDSRYRWKEATDRTHFYVDDEGAGAVGFVEQLLPTDFNACDMSTAKWVWARFNNLGDAQKWVEVCVRMNHAS